MEPEAPDLEKWGGKWDGHAFKPFNRYKISHEYQNRKNSNPPHPSDKRKNPRNSVTMGRLINRMLPGLLSTLTKLNPKFHYSPQFNPKRILTKPSERVHNQGYDNKEHNYLLYVNDLIASPRNRYRVIDLLGQGSFGQAAKCLDETTGEYVAVKIVKSLPAYHNQALVEVKLLQMINQHFDPDTYPIVKLLDYFVFRNHLCLVFELLSVSLYELIRQNQYRGLSLKLIVLFLKQLLISLDSLSQLRIMHCDLKPENILLEDISGPSLKLIDFGSACFEFQAIYTYIQSRFYRSPEVLLGMPYRLPIDVWSLGCVCFELFVGLPLFPGQNEHRMLYRITKVLGMPPLPMLVSGKQTLKYFNKTGSDNLITDYQLKTDAEFMKENNITQLPPYREYFKYDKMEDIIMYYEYKTGLSAEELEHERTQRRAFIHMLQQMLRWDPDQRWTPAQLLTHPLITGQPFTGDYTPPPVARQQRIITRSPAQPQHPSVVVSSHTNSYPVNVHQQPAQSYFDQLSPTGPSYMNPQYIYGQGQAAALQPQQQQHYTQQLGTSPSVNTMLKRQHDDRHAQNNKNKNNNNNNPPRKNSHQPSPNNKQAQQRRNRSYSQSGSEYNSNAGNNAGQSTHYSQRQGRGQNTHHNQQYREYNNNNSNQTRGRSNTMANNSGTQSHVNNNQPAKKHMTPPHKSHRNRSNSSPPTPIEITNATTNQGKLTTHNTPQRAPQQQQQQRQTYSIRVPRQKFASDDHGGASRSWEKTSMMTSPHSSSYQQYSPVKSTVPLMTAVDPSPRASKERETRDEVMKDSNVSDQTTLSESAARVGESPQSPVIPPSPQDDMMDLSKSTLMDKVIEEEDDSVFSSESDTMVDPSPRDGMMSEQTSSDDWAWDPTYSDDQLLSSDQSAAMMGQSPPTHQFMAPQQYQQQYAVQQGNAVPSQSFLGMSPYDRGMYYPPQHYNAQQYNTNYSQQRNYYPPKRNK